MKKYEVEVTRRNVTPKQFYNYCNKRFKEKTNSDLAIWIEYEQWTDPINPEGYRNIRHEDWDIPLWETSATMPYEVQYFVQNTYNFIMEFEFSEDNKGDGYMYAVEFE